MPRGLYLLHTFNRPRRRIARIVSAAGHRIAAWDEEGLVWLSEEVYAARRIDHEVLRHVSRIYAWGEQHAEALRRAGVRNDIRVLGNPRADLLRPQLRTLHEAAARELRRRYGEFILVNSNFGWLNYALMPEGRADPEARLRALARRSGHPLEYMRYRQTVFEAFLELLPVLSREFPDRRIIVRPHPSESTAPWKAVADALPNVEVVYDSDLVAWLMAAGAMIHNGCTTAVEYALLDRVPISFEPLRDERYDSPQPRQASVVAETPEEVCARIRADEGGGRVRDALRRMVAGLGTARLSASVIAEDLLKLAPPPARPSLRGLLPGTLRALEKRLASFSPRSSSSPAYLDKKFPDLSEMDLKNRLMRLAAVCESGKEFSKVEKLSNRIFQIM
jgi:surface carbohydrate biosynthesis protein